MQIITAAVIKGGTGKTTTAAAIAQAGTAAGKKVLALDLDPQGNLSAAIAADMQQPGSYELLTGTAAAAQIIQTTPQGIEAIAASPNLAAFKSKPGAARKLAAALEPIRGNYDLIIIDTPPQADILTFSALQASTGLIIPLESDGNSLQGLYNIEGIAQQIKESNPALSFTGVIICRFNSRPKINRFYRDTIKEKAEAAGVPYLGEIRQGVAIREAQAMQQSLFDYAPESNPAQDYKQLFNKIMQEA